VKPIQSIAERAYHRARRDTAKAGATIRATARRCCYCRVPLIPGDPGPQGATVDHRVPLIQGGTNAPSNLLAACRSCNSSKSYKTPEQAAMIPK